MAGVANLAAVRHLRPVPDSKPPLKLHERGEVKPSIRELERWATVLRLDCVRRLAVAKSGHLDSSLSAADIVAALYYRVLRHDPENPGSLALGLDGLDGTAQVFGVLSDGDCQEGQTWEAATSAVHFGVSNLTAIVDYNHLQTDGTTEEVMDVGDIRAKFEAFGWDAVEIDGHDMGAIVEALERSRTLGKPAAIVCQTKKGRGVSFMEDRFGFHGKPPSQEQAEQAMEELEATYEQQTRALEG